MFYMDDDVCGGVDQSKDKTKIEPNCWDPPAQLFWQSQTETRFL